MNGAGLVKSANREGKKRYNLVILAIVIGTMAIAVAGCAVCCPMKIIIALCLVVTGFLNEVRVLLCHNVQYADDRGIMSSIVVSALILVIIYNRYLEFLPVMAEKDWDVLFGFGVICFAAGMVVRGLAQRALGAAFTYSIQIVPGHRLVQSGVYAMVRHPGYLGVLLLVLGVSFLFGVYTGVALIACASPLTFHRMRREEKLLVDHFGDDYRQYQKKVKKIIPFIL